MTPTFLLALSVVLLASFGEGKGGYGLSARYRRGSIQFNTAIQGDKKNYGPSSGGFAPKAKSEDPAKVAVPATKAPETPVVAAQVTVPATKAPETPVVAAQVTEPVIKAPETPVVAAQVTVPVTKAPETPISITQPIAQASSVPKVEEEQAIPLELQLKKQILEEAASREKRKLELNQLETQLSQSLKRKEEVENMISNEINKLKPRLMEELEKESVRLQSLSSLQKSFQSACSSKKDAIKQEENVLSQMKEVRSRIKEDVVAIQLDAAILKKGDLITIEQTINRDIENCVTNIANEIADANSKLSALANVISAMPSGSDTNANRKYTWDDVSSLQSQLSESIQAASARDDKVRQFIKTFDDAMKRRGIVLGEPLPQELVATFQPQQAATVDSRVSVKSVMNMKKPTQESLPTPSILQLAEVLSEKKDEELTKTATRSLTKSGDALLKVSTGLLSASGEYLKTKEAQESKVSLAIAGESISNVAKGFQRAYNAASQVWQDTVVVTPINDGTVDEYSSRISKGVSAVINNKEVKESLANIVNDSKKAVVEFVAAVSLTSSSIGTIANSNPDVSSAFTALRDNINLLLSIGLVGTQRVSGQKFLPGSIDRENK